MIRRAALVLLATVVGAAGPLRSDEVNRQTVRTPSGFIVEVIFRTLRPGDPLLVVLRHDPRITAASVKFQSQRAFLRSAGGEKDRMAFLGIDLDVKSGSYPLDIRIETAGRAPETLRREVVVVDKEFPFTKLTMKEEYVTPPKAVRERIRLESELVAVVLGKVTPEWLGDGSFVRPSPAPAWPNFGQRRLTNDVLTSVHAGLDVRVPAGGAIHAANAGRVVLASHLYLGGKTVIIDHGLGVFSSYGHMAKLLVKRGEEVRKGAVIGLCGSTGRSTGPHLHWAFKILGSRVDPEAMLLLPLASRNSLPSKRAKNKTA
jgi:murein DD-endopeptidase MepM/ murein hydrolase activator NlpD